MRFTLGVIYDLYLYEYLQNDARKPEFSGIFCYIDM